MHDSDEHGSVTAWLTTITVSPDAAETAWRNRWDRYAPARQAMAWQPLVGGRKPLADAARRNAFRTAHQAGESALSFVPSASSPVRRSACPGPRIPRDFRGWPAMN